MEALLDPKEKPPKGLLPPPDAAAGELPGAANATPEKMLFPEVAEGVGVLLIPDLFARKLDYGMLRTYHTHMSEPKTLLGTPRGKSTLFFPRTRTFPFSLLLLTFAFLGYVCL